MAAVNALGVTARTAAPVRSRGRASASASDLDLPLLIAVIAIASLGLVMVASTSLGLAERQFGDPFHFVIRQGIFLVLGAGAMSIVLRVPLALWERLARPLFFATLVLLAAVLVPGVGWQVNGSVRWIPLGPLHLQVSELAKFAAVVYLADYVVRHAEAVRTTARGFLIPMALLCVAGFFLLLEPDFGSTGVLMATALGLLFLAGVRLWQFGLLFLTVSTGLGLLAVLSPYRLARLTSFLNPWADPFSSGFQLTQALIAIGRGGWLGVGLGNSVQKLFYLPEAHTDFLFSILAEELGLLGVVVVVVLFGFVVWRAFRIGRRAERAGQAFGAYLAYGIGLWVGLQAYLNIGVNLGVLPTKGLTLPLMSYGGSSLLMNCIAIGLLLRVDRETRRIGIGARRVAVAVAARGRGGRR